LSHRYCYLPLSWKSWNWFECAVGGVRWNWFECAVGGVRHPQHTRTGSNTSMIAADSSNGVTLPDAVDTALCAPDDGWKYQPKHVQQFPYVNKLCNVVSCWIYEYTGILLGVHYSLHISRIRVNKVYSHLIKIYCLYRCYPKNSNWLVL
jgi:hypothetical protein